MSASTFFEARRLAFLAVRGPSCACRPLELREEGGRLECAHCAAPLVAVLPQADKPREEPLPWGR